LESDLLICDQLVIHQIIQKNNKDKDMIDFKIFFKIRIHFEYGLDDRDN